jgi:hypothetical protein
MQFAIKCLIGLTVLALPCAYDTDPGEPSTSAVVASVSSVNRPTLPDVVDLRSLNGIPASAP